MKFSKLVVPLLLLMTLSVSSFAFKKPDKQLCSMNSEQVTHVIVIADLSAPAHVTDCIITVAELIAESSNVIVISDARSIQTSNQLALIQAKTTAVYDQEEFDSSPYYRYGTMVKYDPVTILLRSKERLHKLTYRRGYAWNNLPRRTSPPIG